MQFYPTLLEVADEDGHGETVLHERAGRSLSGAGARRARRVLALSRGVLGAALSFRRRSGEETWKKCRGNDPDARLTACTS